MQQLAMIQPAPDPYAAWLAANAVAYCQRMRATITHTACAENKQRSDQACGDNRCRFCDGLDDQAGPVPEHQPEIIPDTCFPEVVDGPPVADLADDALVKGIDVEPPARIGATVMDDVEMEELLSELFGDEGSEDEDEERGEQRRVVYLDDPPERRQSVPVYIGRCRRCGGYMLNALERHDGIIDDDVYRCFSCGWRTSKTYETNRILAAKGVMP
ncbi:hypothetical protein [Pelobacter propionicus]|uniref:Uncharacterized protein n=1 Tax=Pelobacter propionicus (strain DSM 2379 / NBRC 103807 / OttBd1) TaxID=338966 RepID=A1ARM6_PELPD|nr:hypothetical protein [Pelobacter propionicus]ABK99996.1 hypothetical protein Ppro_2390 [Pelobacter propionicus DSM 2379]